MVPMKRIIFALLATIVAAKVTLTPQAQRLTSENFNEVVYRSGKPALILYTTTGCQDCSNVESNYEILSVMFGAAVTIGVVTVDDPANEGTDFGVEVYPTLKWYDEKVRRIQDYQGGTSFRDLANFLGRETRKTTQTPMMKVASTPREALVMARPAGIERLTDQTFYQRVGGNMAVVVAFTDRSKSRIPNWIALTADFSCQYGIMFAEVVLSAQDSQKINSEQGIMANPTIKFYPQRSSIGTTYNCPHPATEQQLVDFVNGMANMDRTIGGCTCAYDPAKRIENELNDIAESLKTAVADEANKAAEDIKKLLKYNLRKIDGEQRSFPEGNWLDQPKETPPSMGRIRGRLRRPSN